MEKKLKWETQALKDLNSPSQVTITVNVGKGQIKQAMEKGELSICAAAKETQKLRRQEAEPTDKIVRKEIMLSSVVMLEE